MPEEALGDVALVTSITVSFSVASSFTCTFLSISAYPFGDRLLDATKQRDIAPILEACYGKSCEDVEGDLDQ